jgi:RND family efflux transporter MFP subunit
MINVPPAECRRVVPLESRHRIPAYPVSTRWLLPIVFCALAVAGCGGSEPRQTAAPEERIVAVAAQRAELGNVRAVLHVTGVMTPAADAEFLAFAPEPARVVEVAKNEGDIVAPGELLVRFDIPSVAGEAARRRAELAAASSDLENARAAQARSRDFAERGLIARRELDDAERALNEAQTAVSRAEAAAAAAETAAARALVRAPFGGIVARRLHNPGDVVQGAATDPVLRVVDPRRLEVSASVPHNELSRILPGATGRLIGGGQDRPVSLTVSARGIPADAGASGMVTIRLTPAEPTTFAVDTPVQVDIDLDERTGAVLVPQQSLVGSGDTAVVFVASGNRAERRAVTTGVVDGDRIEITSGIRPGELVITRGQTGLEDGALISADTGAR